MGGLIIFRGIADELERVPRKAFRIRERAASDSRMEPALKQRAVKGATRS